LPPLIALDEDEERDQSARDIITLMQPMEMEAKDNLLEAKISQAQQQNRHRKDVFPFKNGERVVLSTAHRRRTYKSGDQPRVAKFMPRFDGPYKVTATDEKHSTVTLDLPEHSTLFPVFHTSEVKLFVENDDSLFPTRALHPPDPVAIDGHREYFVEKIVDERRRRNARQYLVRWRGEGPEGDLWLAAAELEDCEALDAWQNWKAENAKRPEEAEQPRLTIWIPPRPNIPPLSRGGEGCNCVTTFPDDITDDHRRSPEYLVQTSINTR
jgi:hypothetical protein